MAYLIGWGELVLKWHHEKSKDKRVDFLETGFKWHELGLLAQHFHQQYQDSSYQERLIEFDTTITNILALINSIDNQRLYETKRHKKWTLGRMIQFNTSSPMKNVRTKIRIFKKLNRST